MAFLYVFLSLARRRPPDRPLPWKPPCQQKFQHVLIARKRQFDGLVQECRCGVLQRCLDLGRLFFCAARTSGIARRKRPPPPRSRLSIVLRHAFTPGLFSTVPYVGTTS